MYHVNINQRKWITVISISDKSCFRAKNITRGRESLYNDKRFNPPERHINCKCLCTKQHRCKKCEAKNDRTERRNRSTVIIGGFSSSFSIVDRSTRQTISKDTEEIKNTLNKQVIINICGTPNQTTVECPYCFQVLIKHLPRQTISRWDVGRPQEIFKNWNDTEYVLWP